MYPLHHVCTFMVNTVKLILALLRTGQALAQNYHALHISTIYT